MGERLRRKGSITVRQNNDAGGRILRHVVGYVLKDDFKTGSAATHGPDDFEFALIGKGLRRDDLSVEKAEPSFQLAAELYEGPQNFRVGRCNHFVRCSTVYRSPSLSSGTV